MPHCSDAGNVMSRPGVNGPVPSRCSGKLLE